MKFLEEARIFVGTILKWLYLFFGAFIFLFVFGFKEVIVLGKTFLIPFFAHESFTVMIFKKIKEDLLPEGVELIVTSPIEAFWAQLSIALFLAFILTMPYFLYSFLKYLLPAFKQNEKKAIFKILFPSIILFFSGCLFSYYLLIPSTVNLLYVYYVQTIDVMSFFALREFIPLVLALCIGVGVIFMLPVVMILLTSLGVIHSDFWKNNWRNAFLFFLIVSAIITPDGTGITMIFLSLPLTVLYAVGYYGGKKFSKETKKEM
jgi:sec-independent protein translocase protein TatC